MKRWLLLAALATLLQASEISPERYLAHIKYLASPEMNGRMTGSPELEKAAAYIAKQFRAAGLKPVAGSYLQQFDVLVRSGLSQGSRLDILVEQKLRELHEGRDFMPLNLSTNGSTIGPVVFAGYGITAPEYHYDDYEKIDARGKIVLVMKHEPQEADEHSVFNGKSYTLHSEFASKVANAKAHGAAGVLIVNDLPNHSGQEDQIEKFTPSVGMEDYGLLVAQISANYASELLATAKHDLAELVKGIDSDLKPRSFDFPSGDSAKLVIKIEKETHEVHNVVGMLPGETNEYIIIGAHYDHLGTGEHYSLAPSQMGTIHPGADDNASGTAGVIELARELARTSPHKRGFLFLCFAGEEEGLLGSAYYAGHPEAPLSSAVAMINLDMIGRLRDNKVYVGGVGTGSTFKPLVEKAAKDADLTDDLSETGGYGSSDHTSFTVKGVPTLFFFSGLHGDYHKPGDIWEKINENGAVKVLNEVAEIATNLAEAPERPKFVKVQPPQNPHAGSAAGTVSSGYGPYFGSIPDFGGPPKGVRFSEIREGSPAAQAGLKAGDVMIEFGGQKIDNLYDFTYALRQHKAGDKVSVTVLREDKPLTVDVVLAKRQ